MNTTVEDFLSHYGVKGMKWDVRRYQYKDGSLTPEGKRRLGIGEDGKVGSAWKKESASNKSSTSGSSKSSGGSSSTEAASKGNNTSSGSAKPKSSLSKAEDEVFKKQMVEANNQAVAATGKVYEKWADKLQGYGDIKKSPYFDEYIKEYSEVLESSMNAHARVSGNKNIEVDGDVFEITYKVKDGLAEAVLTKVPYSENDNKKKSSIRQMNEEGESLTHHGILGMKWGIRRFQREDGSRTPAGKRREKQNRASEDYEEAMTLRSRGSKNLSTKELQTLTQRLNLEKQYKEMNPSDFDKGMNFIKKVTAAGTTVAALYGLSKTPLGQDLIKLIKSKAK